MCEFGSQIVLPLPDSIDTAKKNRTISCDICCVELLKHLWSKGINTLGHCCGHGKLNPSIIITDGYEERDFDNILDLIRQVDNRYWDIYQWQLVKVNI